MIALHGLVPVLAKIESPVQGQPLGKLPVLLFQDIVIIVAMAVVVLSLLMLWVWQRRRRKPKKHPDSGEKVYHDSETREAEEAKRAAEEAEEVRRRQKYKYRWKRRQHRSRNPTLAETGGLPPERSEESPKPS